MDELDFDLAVLERRLHQARQNAVQAELAAAGLQEIGHPMLLCMLGLAGRRPEAPLRTQRELAQMLNVSPAAVTASLRSLERKGYLLRETGQGDARCNQVRLTDKGRQAVDACMDCLARVSRRMYAGISPQELEAVRGFIQQGVDYIIVDPIVSTGWDAVLTECDDAGIPVIVIDRTIDDSDKYVTWVGSDFKTEGLACGEWLKAYAEAKGITEINALVIEGSTGASATIGRTEGFKEVADREGWTILDSQNGDFTEAGGQEVMESYCQSYEGQFNVVICQNDNEAYGAMTAMDAAGVSYGVDGDVIIVSFDSNKPAVQHVLEGNMNATFECNPMAAPFVEEVIQQLEAGETPEKEIYMDESWFAAEDIVSSITVDGTEMPIIHVTQEVLDARPY